MLNKLLYLLIILSSVFFSCKKNIQGCTDALACNYNAEANTDDSSCELPLANYDCENTCINDADADGVCDESEIEGCTDSLACNYSMLATESDSSCEFAMTYYDCEGACLNDIDNDGSCDENEVLGCVDSLACNYSSLATESDESCEYVIEFFNCEGECINDDDNDNVCNELEIEGCTSSGACNYFSLATDDDGTCEFPETFYNCEGICLNDQDNDGLCDEFEVAGCMSSNACNFDALATDDDASCIFALDYYNCLGNCINDADADGVCNENEVPGCTDGSACNYSVEATEENNSCSYPEPNYNCNGEELVQVGDFAYGGVVFYVDETGEHGLVCAPSNLITVEGWSQFQWMDISVSGNQYIQLNGTTSTLIGAGASNSSIIISSQAIGADAASMSSLLDINGYDDWYLPSLAELWEINYHRELVTSVAIENGGAQLDYGFYWSSSQVNLTDAWCVNFVDIEQAPQGSFELSRGKMNGYLVRPIRSF